MNLMKIYDQLTAFEIEMRKVLEVDGLHFQPIEYMAYTEVPELVYVEKERGE